MSGRYALGATIASPNAIFDMICSTVSPVKSVVLSSAYSFSAQAFVGTLEDPAWDPKPNHSIPAPWAYAGATHYALELTVTGTHVKGTVWRADMPKPSADLAVWDIDASVPGGTGVGWYAYGAPTPPDAVLECMWITVP